MKATIKLRYWITYTTMVMLIFGFGLYSRADASLIVDDHAFVSKYNHYFGQLHAHTDLSDGIGTPEEAYNQARLEGGADFFAITDHSNNFDNDRNNEDISRVADSTSEKWKKLHEAADKANVDGSFIAIAGYEMTWSEQTAWGHINTYNTPWFASKNNSRMDLPAYYAKLSQPENNQAINQFNHPGIFGDFGDFGFYSEEVDQVMQLIEVGNGESSSLKSTAYHRFHEMYTRALDKGWHLAPTNNQDNHKGNFITANDIRTVVLAEALTREAIFEAIRNRRVYATEDRNLEITYEINGMPMGSILKNPSVLNIHIYVSDPDVTDHIQSISLISDGGKVVAKTEVNGNQKYWRMTLLPTNRYYFVRVVSEDGDIALTAPIWTGKDSISQIIVNDLWGHWAKQSVERLIENEVIRGYSDGTFRPDSYVTRGEFVKMITETLEFEDVEATLPEDVKYHWSATHVAIALGHNIVKGYPDGTFKPNNPITRQEMAVMLYEAKKLKASSDYIGFKDFDRVADWASEAVGAAIEAGYMIGYEDDTIRPNAFITRAETATVFLRLIE